MSTTLPTAARPRTKRSFDLPKWVYGAGLVLLILGLLFVVTLVFGRISGEEFAPQTFQRRTFHYYEVPLLRLQVWPVKRFNSTGDVEDKLVKQKLLPAATVAIPRWDLVRGYRGSKTIAEGDALILIRYLDEYDDTKNTYIWNTWTTDQPDIAKVFWPHVARLAEQELYFFLPDLFELAVNAKHASTFTVELEKLLATKYYDFGIVQQKLGHHAAAVQLLTEATKLSPDNKEWQAALETSRQAAPPETPASEPNKAS